MLFCVCSLSGLMTQSNDLFGGVASPDSGCETRNPTMTNSQMTDAFHCVKYLAVANMEGKQNVSSYR